MPAQKLKTAINRVLFSNKAYNAFLRPFDRMLYPVVNWRELKEERARAAVPLNKIPHVADLCNREWHDILEDFRIIFSMNEESFHRKIWEFTQIIYVLKKLGYLHPDNRGLAIGAGREQILYYLAYKIKKMVAVDLYEGSFLGGEDEPDIPDIPEKYAPFLYPRENLDFRRMNALELQFADNSFDFVFSASSIEHFGGLRQIEKAIAEMYRVLKPGGACTITTEIRLNRLAGRVPNTRIFSVNEVLDLFERNGFLLAESGMDLRIEDHYLHNWVKLPQEVFKSPHVILRFLNSVFTSLAVTFKKEGNAVKKGAWKSDIVFSPLVYRGRIQVSGASKIIAGAAKLGLDIQLTNECNFTWHTKGLSHRIAIGIQLLDESGSLLNPALGEIVIPKDVAVGETFAFRTELSLTLPPGKYRLFFDLKRELITWFHEKGSVPAVIPVEIAARTGQLASS